MIITLMLYININSNHCYYLMLCMFIYCSAHLFIVTILCTIFSKAIKNQCAKTQKLFLFNPAVSCRKVSFVAYVSFESKHLFPVKMEGYHHLSHLRLKWLKKVRMIALQKVLCTSACNN